MSISCYFPGCSKLTNEKTFVPWTALDLRSTAEALHHLSVRGKKVKWVNEADTQRQPRGWRNRTLWQESEERSKRKIQDVIGVRLQMQRQKHVKRFNILLGFFLAIEHHHFCFTIGALTSCLSSAPSLYSLFLHLCLLGPTTFQLSSLFDALKPFPLFSLSLPPFNFLPSFLYFPPSLFCLHRHSPYLLFHFCHSPSLSPLPSPLHPSTGCLC